MEYILPRLRVAVIIKMMDFDAIDAILLQLVQLEEERFGVGFHQNVEKKRKKGWHDRHIKNKQFEIGRVVLIYDSKFFKHLGKLKTHWLGPYVVKEITDGGAVKLEKIDGIQVRGLITGS